MEARNFYFFRDIKEKGRGEGTTDVRRRRRRRIHPAEVREEEEDDQDAVLRVHRRHQALRQRWLPLPTGKICAIQL